MWKTYGDIVCAAMKKRYLCEKKMTTMKDNVNTFEYENKIAGLEACITKLKSEYERQQAISKCAMLEKKTMEREIEVLKGKLEAMHIVQAASSHEAPADVAADNETAVTSPAEMRQGIYAEVIEKLIAEGEQWPSNQNDRAEVLKSAIQSLMLAEGMQLPAELRARLQNLGRKEATMARAMVEVTGNDKVIFGGHGNG